MNADTIIKYSIAIVCIIVLAFITFFQALFDLKYILLVFALSTILAVGGIYNSSIREKLSKMIAFAVIGLYILLFIYVLSKSPELSFQKFRKDTLTCTVIVLVCSFCLFIFGMFRNTLKNSVTETNKLITTFSVAAVLTAAFAVVSIIHGKLF